MPQISVIVPVYKVEQYLNRCVDSILAQTFTDFELILVDDGSPDNCGAICDEYAKKDSRVVVIHQKNGGLSAARNAGIDWAFANSDSQWLTFIDSDDWIHPEYLERLLNAAMAHQVSVSICEYETTNGAEVKIPPDSFESSIWDTEMFFVKHNVTATIACAKLYRKECFESIHYPVGKIHEDEFTTYKILFQYPAIAFIPAPMYSYFNNSAGITKSGQSRFCEDKYSAIEEQIQYFHENGFPDACRSRVRIYLTMVHDQIQKLKQDQSSKSFLALMYQKKRRFFATYARRLNPNEHGDAWVLTKIYPKCMWLYWRTHAVLKKLKLKRG